MNEKARVRDILQNMQWEDIPDHLESRRQEIHESLQKMMPEKDRNDMNTLYFQCLAKASELMGWFNKAWGADLYLACTSTRCMLELDLLIRLFEEEPEYRTRFFYSVIWDEKDIWQSYLSISPYSKSALPLNNYIQRLDDIEKRRELSRKRDYIGRIQWSQLAKRFDKEGDYRTIHQWASKMLHITPFSVLRMNLLLSPENEEVKAAWEMLLIMILLYLEDILQRISGMNQAKLKFE